MELFNDIPQELSPKLRWMNKHKIHVEQVKDGAWVAFKERTTHSVRADSYDDALNGLVKRLKIRYWNEE